MMTEKGTDSHDYFQPIRTEFETTGLNTGQQPSSLTSRPARGQLRILTTNANLIIVK